MLKLTIFLLLSFLISAICRAQDGGGFQSQVVAPAPAAVAPPGAPAAPPVDPAQAGTGTTSPAPAAKEDADFNPMDWIKGMAPAGDNATSPDAHYEDTDAGDGTGGYEPSSFDSQQYLLNTGAVGACGGSVNMWRSTVSVVTDKVIPGGSGYSLQAPSYPVFRGSGENLTVRFEPGGASHCSSATAAAFAKYIVDLSRSGKLNLNSGQVSFLNSLPVRKVFLGATFSVAVFNQALGGQNRAGSGREMAEILRSAKPGDVLKFDRKNRTGHSTIFKSFDGTNVCFWSSNRGTNGPGVKCERLSGMVQLAISRFPPPEAIQKNIDTVRANPQAIRNAYGAQIGAVRNSQLTCAGTDEDAEAGGSEETSEAVKEDGAG